jgi:RNA polymerase sigma-70 factor (ECF subfamily)
MDERPDEYLVTHSLNGDRDAYSALIRRNLKRVFAVCLGMLGNQPDAEDATQEVFIRGLERMGTLRNGERFSPWISQIARNRCRDLLRAQKRRRVVSIEDDRPASDHGAVLHAPAPSEDFTDLRLALDRLPEVHRVPLLLFYYDGKNTRTLARELNLSVGGACARLYRARKALRELLVEVEQNA